MNTQRIHISSLLLTLLSFLFELSINQSWIESDNQDLVFGFSLAFILVALGLNIKVVRAMGVPDKEKKKSQAIVLLISAYAVLIYGLELI